MSDQLTELAYDAAVRALDLQERAVEQLRNRTGILLAATSLTASFLGAQAIEQDQGIGTIELLALVSLTLSIAACIYVLLPKRGFVFSLNGPVTYQTLFAVADDPAEMRRRLIYWLEGYWSANQRMIDDLGRFYGAAALMLTLQLGLWCVALASSIS